ncbi:hypothetical protein CTAYLR_008300 [Chrysophaeum taylorii]|uniref:C-type lectin domain-containing protein n=1 Tax=Chrysophaeum taylorii TaxID=2483200 RepID=A0AAD7U7D7_9STRA|nr:hypothetical protein CTAYLR_008300 [Chrysophaeum taylorii]
MVRWIATVVVVVPAALGACPSGWSGSDGSACFKIPESEATFVECQEKVCSSEGGTLASIHSDEEQEAVEALMRESRAPRVFLGLFEAGADESGEWRWVDGSTPDYANWNSLEPNECTDEDCAIFMPVWLPDGWSDASCTLEARCLCRLGGEPSDEFESQKASLDQNDNDYASCGDDDICAQGGFGGDALTPEQIAYEDVTCAEATDLAWAPCCCGFAEFCCDKDECSGCEAPFSGPSEDACFYVSTTYHSFVECEDLCEGMGGTLASIRGAEEEAWLEAAVGLGVAYIGAFEAGPDESGDWRWVDGGSLATTYSRWAPGDPDDWCVDEDCALFAPAYFPGWVDASCGLEDSAVCICRAGGAPSAPYESARASLERAAPNYDECDDDDDHHHQQSVDDDSSSSSSSYCVENGFDAGAWTPNVRAYPPPPQASSHPLESDDGYSQGLCGFAAWERDGAWARCCCGDQAYCCPDGEEASNCMASPNYNPDCPRGFNGPGVGSGCFELAPKKATFVGCHDECAKIGAELASVRSSTEMTFVRDMLEAESAAAFVGLFEYGEDESGDWRWVDGSTSGFDGWALGQPDNWCLDEDCAVLAPDERQNWIDASCTLEAFCLCRSGEAATADFIASIDELNDASADYTYCDAAEAEDNEERLILHKLKDLAREVTAILALVCVLLVAAVVAAVFLVMRHRAALRAMREDPMPAYGVELATPTTITSAYNNLIPRESRAAAREVTAILALVCVLLVAAVVAAVFLVMRHRAALRAMREDPMPAYGVELATPTTITSAYNNLIPRESRAAV